MEPEGWPEEERKTKSGVIEAERREYTKTRTIAWI